MLLQKLLHRRNTLKHLRSVSTFFFSKFHSFGEQSSPQLNPWPSKWKFSFQEILNSTSQNVDLGVWDIHILFFWKNVCQPVKGESVTAVVHVVVTAASIVLLNLCWAEPLTRDGHCWRRFVCYLTPFHSLPVKCELLLSPFYWGAKSGSPSHRVA